MSALTDLIASDPTVSPMFKEAMLRPFQARVGQRARFATEAEANAYEAGWNAFHDGLACPGAAPWSTGWLHAERANEKERELFERELRDRANWLDGADLDDDALEESPETGHFPHDA